MSEEQSYLDHIPEQYRDVPSIAEAGSMEALIEQHVNLERKMGTSLPIPGEDADDAQRGEFYKRVMDKVPGLTRIPDSSDSDEWGKVYAKLGRPEDYNSYEAPEVKGPDGNPLPQPEFADEFKEFSHGIGLTASQYSKINEFMGTQTVKILESQQGAKQEVMGELKKEWGDSVEARISRAEKLVTKIGGESTMQALGDVRGNPALLVLLDGLADALSEDSSISDDTGGGPAESRSQIEDKISELKGNEAFTNKKSPDHDRVVSRVNELYEQLQKYKAA